MKFQWVRFFPVLALGLSPLCCFQGSCSVWIWELVTVEDPSLPGAAVSMWWGSCLRVWQMNGLHTYPVLTRGPCDVNALSGRIQVACGVKFTRYLTWRGEEGLGYPRGITGSLQAGRSASDPWNVAKAPLAITCQGCKPSGRSSGVFRKTKPCLFAIVVQGSCLHF